MGILKLRVCIMMQTLVLFTAASYPTGKKRIIDKSFTLPAPYIVGKNCMYFEEQVQKLCTSESRSAGGKLAILMANCNLETLGQPPLSYDTHGLLNATDAQQSIVVTILARLPVYCATLNVHGIRMGLMTDENMKKLNATLNEMRGEWSAANANVCANSSIEIQKDILKQLDFGAQNSKIVQEMAFKTQKEVDNLAIVAKTLLDKYEKMSETWNKFDLDEKAAHALVNITAREAQMYWEKAQLAMRRDIAGSVSTALEKELGMLQIILGMAVVLVVYNYYDMSYRRTSALAMMPALLIFSVYTAYVSSNGAIRKEWIEPDGTVKASVNFAKIVTTTKQTLDEIVAVQGIIQGYYVVVALCVLLPLLIVFRTIFKMMRRTSPSAVSRGQRSRLLDICNTDEVLAFLRKKENDMQQVETRLATIIHDIKRAVSEGDAQRRAVYSRFSDRSSSRQQKRIDMLARKVNPKHHNVTQSVPPPETVSAASNVSATAHERKRAPRVVRRPKDKPNPETPVEPCVVTGNRSTDYSGHDTDVTVYSLPTISSDSILCRVSKSTSITQDGAEVPDGFDPNDFQHDLTDDEQSVSEVESNASTMTTTITEWDGIPHYPPQNLESEDSALQKHDSDVEMEQDSAGNSCTNAAALSSDSSKDESTGWSNIPGGGSMDSDSPTTEITAILLSQGETTDTWSTDSGKKCDYGAQSEKSSKMPCSPVKRGNAGVSGRIIVGRKKPRDNISLGGHIASMRQRERDREGARNPRQGGRRAEPQQSEMGKNSHELRRGDRRGGKSRLDNNAPNQSLPQMGPDYSGPMIPTQTKPYYLVAKTDAEVDLHESLEESSREASSSLSKSKSGSKAPRRRKSQSSTTPSHYNLRRKSGPSTPSTYNLRRRP